MKTATKEMVIVVRAKISEEDLEDLQIDNTGWSVKSEVISWLSDLGFEIDRCEVYEGNSDD
jgi:hypothetical protein